MRAPELGYPSCCGVVCYAASESPARTGVMEGGLMPRNGTTISATVRSAVDQGSGLAYTLTRPAATAAQIDAGSGAASTSE